VGPFLYDIRREEFALGFLTFDLMKDQIRLVSRPQWSKLFASTIDQASRSAPTTIVLPMRTHLRWVKAEQRLCSRHTGNTRATDIRQSVLALEESHYWDTVAKA